MIVIYKSSTGFTQKYAELIAKALDCDIVTYKNISKVDFKNHKTVVFGSRIHAGMLDGFNRIKELYLTGKIKNLVIFATGGTPNNATNLIETIWNNNLVFPELKKIPHFYMQAGICYEKMGLLDRLIMKMASHMMNKKENKDRNEEGFVEAVDKSYDISSIEYIKPLIEYIKENNL